MSDSTSFPVVPSSEFDNLPLPERIAQLYGFTLAYHDLDDGKRYYAVQDWIVGVAQTEESSKFWHNMKRRLKKANLDITEQCQKLRYKAKNQKIYKLDYATAETLDSILTVMSLKTGIVSDIVMGKPYQQGRVLEGFVYLITAHEIPGKYKIGITQNINKRIYDMSTVVPVTFRVLHLIECSNMRHAENTLHNMFSEKRLVGEWFALTYEDIEYIQSIKVM
ncbi:MAG: GIY-YIG nuclease family protein [Chloroflexota bacterium]